MSSSAAAVGRLAMNRIPNALAKALNEPRVIAASTTEKTHPMAPTTNKIIPHTIGLIDVFLSHAALPAVTCIVLDGSAIV
jgi:hypothetical protein